MSRYHTVLFDLDGTLTDPAEGITTCVRHALHCQGIEEENYDNLTRMIGPPLAEGFAEFYGMDEAHAWQGVRRLPGALRPDRRREEHPLSRCPGDAGAAAGCWNNPCRCNQQTGTLRAGHRPPL